MAETSHSLSDVACKQFNGRLKIGTCGFGLAMGAYARAFSCVEVQQTFSSAAAT